MTSQNLHTNLGFSHPITAIVVGASGGIGQAWIDYLLSIHHQNHIIATYHNTQPTYSPSLSPTMKKRLTYYQVDVTSADSIRIIADAIEQLPSPPQLIIYSSGLLHHPHHPQQPERSLKHITWEGMQAIFSINAFGFIQAMQILLPYLPRTQRSICISLSARVGSIGDNRMGGWYSYRASKAAHNMFFKTASLEWGRTHKKGIMLALHPGTVATNLSVPFISKKYSNRVLTPSESVQYQAKILCTATPSIHGKFLAWDGQEIVW